MLVILLLLTPFAQNMYNFNKAVERMFCSLSCWKHLSSWICQFVQELCLLQKGAQGRWALGKTQPWLWFELDFISKWLLFYKNKSLEMGSESVSGMINAEPGGVWWITLALELMFPPSVNKNETSSSSSDWRITNLQLLVFIYLTVSRLCWGLRCHCCIVNCHSLDTVHSFQHLQWG